MSEKRTKLERKFVTLNLYPPPLIYLGGDDISINVKFIF